MLASKEADMEIDEMDSLFEGMVLFDPSQVSTLVVNEQPTPNTEIDDDLKQQKEQPNHQSDSNLSPPSPTAESSSSTLVSQPLDENLFSDLTLVTQTPEQPLPDPSPIITTTASPKTISRQVSTTRKKKRAAGLRIGYKNSDLDSDHQPNPYLEEVKLGQIENSTQQEAPAVTANLSKIENSIEQQPSAAIAVSDTDSVPSETQEPKDTSNSSIELRFEQIRTDISENLKRARELVASISTTRKGNIRRRRKAAEDLSMASTRYRELEKELEEACEAEDFEKADRLSESLASADSEKELLAVALRDVDTECDAVDSKMQEVLELQIAAEEECVSLLQGFAKDAANNADLVLRNAEVKSSTEMSSWLSSVEAVEVKRMELDIESHLVNEARMVFGDSIDHVVEDDRKERELLCKKKEVLTDELEKLLALVRQKEAEIVENESSIEKVDKRIADAISSFQESHSSISVKYDHLQSEILRMEVQNEVLSRKKKEIDEFLSKEEGRVLKIKELAKTSADEANMYQEVTGLRKSLVQFILRSSKNKVRLAKAGDELTKDVQMLKQDISNARASLQELSSSKTSLQQEIEAFKQRLIFIDKRVPELEAEKKVAASVRNFKEAARIAAEAKALYIEKEGTQTKMEGALSEFGKLEENVSDTVNRLQDIEIQLSSKEKELAITRFQMLKLIARAATAERSAALELGDLEEAEILLGEAEVAECEARKLQSTYDFKDEEFENLPKHFISMELVSNLGGKKLAELAASAHVSAS